MTYRARYYDPKIGRFISEDPLGLTADLDLYRYALGNPVNFIDPTGLDVQVCTRRMRHFPLYVPHPVLYLSKKNRGAGFGPTRWWQTLGFPGPGQVEPENPYDNHGEQCQCSTISTSTCMEDCVDTLINATHAAPPKYQYGGPRWAGAYQCSDWSDGMIAVCQESCRREQR